MSESAQRALQVLIASLEHHLGAVDAARSGDDSAVDEAYDAVAAAFERYEVALDLEYAEDLPFVLDDSDDDEDDLDDSDDDEDDLDDVEELVVPRAAGALDADSPYDGLLDDIEEFDLNN